MKLLLLAGNTLRSRAYAQVLSLHKGIEVIGLFYGFDNRPCEGADVNRETREFLNASGIFVPDMNLTLEKVFEENGWQYSNVSTDDVNDETVLRAISDRKPDLVVFSGYGGQILKAGHFVSGIPYLHMHPGSLPSERGSTTLYYSILNGKMCTVSAFFMTAAIDAGTLVLAKKYKVPTSGVYIDKWYDNCLRADCFYHAVKELLVNKISSSNQLSNEPSEEYYVIHPVLKHLAVLSLQPLNNK